MISKYPASLIQKQFWIHYKIQPKNSVYNIPLVFRLKGSLNIEALEESVNAVIAKHEVLRTVFYSENGDLYQVVNENVNAFVSVEDSQNNDLIRVKEKISSDIQQPFDLEKGPLVRIKLIKISDKDYFLLIIMHHIVTDLRSMQVIMREISSSFYGLISGDRNKETEPSLQYSEYSKWQAQYLQSVQYRNNLDFWTEELTNISGYLNLPIDKPRPVVQKGEGDFVVFEISPRDSDEIKQFCRENNTSLFLLTLLAYFILKYRYTGQKEITIGVPFTNRRNEVFEETVGCFVNVLPVTCSLFHDSSCLDVLQQLTETVLEIRKNQEFPNESLVQELLTKRDPSYNPFFQTGFTFEPVVTLELLNVEVKSEKIHNKGSRLDLFLKLWEHEGGLHGLLEYNTALFEPETVERFTGHYKTILLDMVRNLGRTIGRLDILPVTEKEMLEGWNSTACSLNDDCLLHGLFEKQVAVSPTAIACSYRDKKLSYRELDDQASCLAHVLRKKGVRPGVVVGVYIERSLDMLVAILAILKSGGTYVPLDPEFPKDRVLYMLENSEATIILTIASLSEELPPSDAQKINIDDEIIKKEQKLPDNLKPSLKGDDLAYIIYTSGSTGRPKGVMVHHRAVVNFIKSMADTPGIESSDVLLAVTTLSFDIAVLELFLPLCAGAKVVIAPKEFVADGQELKQLMLSEKVSVMQATPTTWRLLIVAGWRNEQLRVFCGGEPMPSDLAEELMQRACSVWNLYGPTETTVWSTCHKVDKSGSTILVGKPINNTTTYVVDRYDQLTPVGVSGELLIGGLGVTKGYYGRPNLTAKNFIADKHNKNFGQRLYRTGDIATYMSDGSIRLIGRIDQQVKLRGHRIELGEIESVLLSHDEIEQAVVVVRDFGGGDQRLVAYYTEKNDAKSPEQLRELLKEKLPAYMIPSFLELLKEMPLTANRKIDKNRLPAPGQTKSGKTTKRLVGTAVEEVLCDIWCEVLQVEQIAVDENFFDKGGNSLLSLHVLEIVEKKLNVRVPAVKFFQYPTISTFAQYLSAQEDTTTNKAIRNKAILQKQAVLQQKNRATKRKG